MPTPISSNVINSTAYTPSISQEKREETQTQGRISRLVFLAICDMVESSNSLKLSLLDIKGYFSLNMYDATSDKSFYQTCQIGASSLKMLGAFFADPGMQQGMGALGDFCNGLAQTYVTSSETGINLNNLALQDAGQKLREDILSQLLQTLNAIQATEKVN